MSNQVLLKSSSLAQIKSHLATLETNKVYSIATIIETIRQVCNHKDSTYRNFKMQSGEYPSSGSVRLDELYVDLTYQRKLRLAKIIQKIIKNEGFCKDVAGTIDVAYRPNRKDPNGRQGMKFVWDGFRRSLMVGLCSPAGSAAKIGASEYDHPIDRSDEECQIDEARKFKIRNADSESMSPEELFKSMVVYKDQQSLELLQHMINCNLTVEGLNPNGQALGGFVAFRGASAKYNHEYMRQASRVITTAWTTRPQVLGYLLGGLTALIHYNDDGEFYTDSEIMKKFIDFAKNNDQNNLTNPRLNAKPFESIAINIAKKVLNDDNGLMEAILNDINIDETERKFLEQGTDGSNQLT